MIHRKPARLSPTKRPRRKTTPFSYSLTIRTPEANTRKTITAGTTSPNAPIKSRILRLLDVDGQPVHLAHCDFGSGGDRRHRDRLPPFPHHEHRPAVGTDFGQRLAPLADQASVAPALR